MASMINMSLPQLAGTWVSFESQSTMWFNSDQSRIVITRNGHRIVSEETAFSYNEEDNTCYLSKSVILHQIFEEDSIHIRVKTESGTLGINLDRRK